MIQDKNQLTDIIHGGYTDFHPATATRCWWIDKSKKTS
jgi:hypothetical protein